MMVSDTGWGNGQKGQCHFRSKFFPIFTIYGHNEFSAKACPCFDVKKEYSQYFEKGSGE